MRLNLSIALVILIAVNSWSGPALALTNPCDPEFVEIDGAGFFLRPSGNDDTDNVQCALDSAVDQNIALVSLGAGSFQVTSLRVSNFKGEFKGQSKSRTTLLLASEGNQCLSQELAGGSNRGIVFYNGNVKVSSMTIEMSDSCDQRYVALNFRQASCDERTLFANIDRVSFIGKPSSKPASETGGNNAISFGYSDDGCGNEGAAALGQLKINRSTFDEFDVATDYRVWGKGEVTISTNEFTNVGLGIASTGSNAVSVIRDNKFFLGNRRSDSGVTHSHGAVLIIDYIGGEFPLRNRTSLDSNRVVFQSETPGYGFRVTTKYSDEWRACRESFTCDEPIPDKEHPITVADNTFNMKVPDQLFVLEPEDYCFWFCLSVFISTGDATAVVSDNSFAGSYAIALEVFSSAGAVFGNVFRGNALVRSDPSLDYDTASHCELPVPTRRPGLSLDECAQGHVWDDREYFQ